MKLCKYIFIVFLLAFTAFSCKKSFLDVPITRTQVAENYITNLSSAEELLNGAYVRLGTEVYYYEMSTYADVVSDNTKVDGGTLFTHYSWSQVADETPGHSVNMNELWMDSYSVIRYCNFILERIDDFRTEDPVKADAIKGQSLALRAFLYSNLVNVFAQPYGYTPEAAHPGVPYDTTYAMSKTETRQTVSDVYNHLISDLTRAIQLIPATVTSKSAISKSAAMAILARVYLFKGDYANAKSIALQVTTATPMMSSTDYPAKLFTASDNESLFWLSPVQTGTSSTAAASYPGYIYSIPSTVRYFATNDIVNAIKERPLDLRNKWFKDTLSNKMVKKFPVGIVTGIVDARRSQYYTLIRSSEMFLTVAEASAKTGDENTARKFLDSVRRRADVTNISSTATGSALLDSIYKERRKELCFEGIRMFDLLRTGKGVTRTDVISPAPAVLPYPSDKEIAPIPLNDVRLYSLEQNNNY